MKNKIIFLGLEWRPYCINTLCMLPVVILMNISSYKEIDWLAGFSTGIWVGMVVNLIWAWLENKYPTQK